MDLAAWGIIPEDIAVIRLLATGGQLDRSGTAIWFDGESQPRQEIAAEQFGRLYAAEVVRWSDHQGWLMLADVYALLAELDSGTTR